MFKVEKEFKRENEGKREGGEVGNKDKREVSSVRQNGQGGRNGEGIEDFVYFSFDMFKFYILSQIVIKVVLFWELNI